jgi:asparagine synthase (glutamine-hydrolysing)
LDNRNELSRELSTGLNPGEMLDSEVMLHSYLEWDEDCPKRMLGDWLFAAWRPTEQRLFLARDHFGTTALYYYVDSRIFAFASSRKALMLLGLSPLGMDELYLAQVLVSWPAYHGERTIYKSIKRLPPAHCITVSPNGIAIRCYWRMEDTPPLHLPKREDYVNAFRVVFDEAVRCRLRSGDCIAVSLSGGLDSGAVAATAAKYLFEENRRLLAFTSVPISETRQYVGERFGNEFSLAKATAEYAGNIDLYSISSDTITPMQAISKMLTTIDEPAHAAANYFWLYSIRNAARTHGCRTLLTGQMGNAGISWKGSIFSNPPTFQIRHLGWSRWTKEMIKRHTSPFIINCFRKTLRPPDGWWKNSAINPELARRLKLWEGMLNDRSPHPATPLEERCRLLMPGRSKIGARHSENGAAYGLEILDPSADVRVLAFTLSIPDHIFIDPKTGMDRWLIREAMKGRLPDEVRLNRRRGRQAADLVPRLRASAGEVETALDELASGPAAAYVNVPYMREVWRMIQTHDTPEAFRKSVTVLTRGIMAGLWVNGFYDAS